MNATSQQKAFVRRIRNHLKRKYAQSCLLAHCQGRKFPQSPDGLSVMAAQAVRMNLQELGARPGGMTKLYSLVSGQGTACEETCLCARHLTEKNKAAVEANASSWGNQIDRAIPGSWTDCSENDALECTVCGAHP